jgi:hypothetical protein
MAFFYIEDPNLLATIKIKELIDPIKDYLTTEEQETYAAASTPDERREKAIKLYKKYGPVILEEERTKELAQSEKELHENDPLPPPDTESTVPLSSTKIEEDKIVALNLTDYLTVELRNIPNKNGMSLLSVEDILSIAFKYPHGSVIFKSKDRAKQFYSLVENVTSIKGLSVIAENRRIATLEAIKRSNKI